MFELNTENDDRRVRHVVLLVTHDCNLRCKYCYEEFKNASMMTIETARTIVDKEFKRLKNTPEFSQIEFACLGGEPLLNFCLIRELVEWTENVYPNKDYFFSLRTNGTLLNSEMKEWLEKYRVMVRVGLSLDGLSEMNIENRASGEVDIAFFTRNWPTERVRLTLFPDTVVYLAKTVRELNSRNIPFVVVPAEGVEWTPQAVKCYESELSKLQADYQTNFWEGFECGLFPFDPFQFFQNKNESAVPYCGSYGNIVCYDAEGVDYPCHILSPITIGKEKALKFREISSTLKLVKIDPVCAGCEIRTSCKPCYGFHYKISGDVGEWTERITICGLRKMLAKASAELYLRAKGLCEERKEIESRDEYVRISMAVRMITGKSLEGC